ncbi:hypothetical protein ACL2XP_12530 [Sodalis sp. RH21]|uniref:hypothetical protein n=1 Tax=unclassified Sodalis (in: enterobacteria) TaxID=2636512 RepID=UPI0039B6A877
MIPPTLVSTAPAPVLPRRAKTVLSILANNPHFSGELARAGNIPSAAFSNSGISESRAGGPPVPAKRYSLRPSAANIAATAAQYGAVANTPAAVIKPVPAPRAGQASHSCYADGPPNSPAENNVPVPSAVPDNSSKRPWPTTLRHGINDIIPAKFLCAESEKLIAELESIKNYGDLNEFISSASERQIQPEIFFKLCVIKLIVEINGYFVHDCMMLLGEAEKFNLRPMLNRFIKYIIVRFGPSLEKLKLMLAMKSIFDKKHVDVVMEAFKLPPTARNILLYYSIKGGTIKSELELHGNCLEIAKKYNITCKLLIEDMQKYSLKYVVLPSCKNFKISHRAGVELALERHGINNEELRKKYIDFMTHKADADCIKYIFHHDNNECDNVELTKHMRKMSVHSLSIEANFVVPGLLPYYQNRPFKAFYFYKDIFSAD